MLPKISIITITRNRAYLFPFTINVINNLNYPKDNIEWIIIDDGIDDLLNQLPNDNRIKYFHLNSTEIKNIINYLYVSSSKTESQRIFYNFLKIIKKLPIGFKRNLGIYYSTSDYIFFLDDDDIYPKDSIIERINIFNKNKDIDCIYCKNILTYDIDNKNIGFLEGIISEATLCFRKNFWIEKKFCDFDIENEGVDFINNRKLKSKNISNCDLSRKIIITINHKLNNSTRSDLKYDIIKNVELSKSSNNLIKKFGKLFNQKMYYSENASDLFILELNDLFKLNQKYFLDITNNLIKSSNTYLLEEKNWKGYIITNKTKEKRKAIYLNNSCMKPNQEKDNLDNIRNIDYLNIDYNYYNENNIKKYIKYLINKFNIKIINICNNTDINNILTDKNYIMVNSYKKTNIWINKYLLLN